MRFYKYYYYVCKKGGNMKRILSILVTLLALSAYAEHEYIPFLQEGNAWVQESIENDYGRDMITDTVTIDGKEYCVLSFRALIIYESIIWD
jgi:hypothetical protein